MRGHLTGARASIWTSIKSGRRLGIRTSQALSLVIIGLLFLLFAKSQGVEDTPFDNVFLSVSHFPLKFALRFSANELMPSI